ncbi:hypothetical protein [Nocardioides sp. MH1]|uniref:hypothetical protein n=1 Tax=Nocardioides sp. MH1 TaxID=3242490 RepID=UPI0035222A3E
MTGKHEATIRRAYRTAEAAGYLVMHEKGDRGQQRAQGRGHQTVFHYTTPDDPWPCSECGPTAAEGVQVEHAKGVQIGAQIGCTHYSLSNDRDAPPVSTPGAPAPQRDTYASIVAAISAADRTSGDDIDDPTSSPRRQLTTSSTTLPPVRSDPSPPTPPIGATATTDRAREDDDDGFRWPSSWRVI